MKSLLLFFAASVALIAGYDNIRYPEANKPFVYHTLVMDTTFQTGLRSRAITDTRVHWLAHYFLALSELVCGTLCLLGSILFLVKSTYAKAVSTWGLLTGVAIWFFGFRAIGGEYFGMWQSKQWNGLPDGERIALCFLAILKLI